MNEASLIKYSLSVKEIRLLEEKAKKIGLTERILIENASSSLYEALSRLSLGKKALVISGRGNNAADVLSCARKLYSRGYEAKVVVLEDKELGLEAAFQKEVLKKMNLPLEVIKPADAFKLKAILKNCDFILEGILGIGVKGKVSPFLKEVIGLINQSGRKIVSCDIPSGLCPQQGIVLGAAVKADYTVTFIAPKKGFFVNQGKDYCGRILIADIGISRQVLEHV